MFIKKKMKKTKITNSPTDQITLQVQNKDVEVAANTQYIPQFFRLPRMPCRSTAVGGSGIDLSVAELHFTCTESFKLALSPMKRLNRNLISNMFNNRGTDCNFIITTEKEKKNI